MIKPSDIGFEKYISGSDWISDAAIKANKATIYKPNTVLIICIGGGIGRLGIVNKICSSNQQITGILFKENVIAEYGYYFFLSRYKIFEANSSKSTLPIINQKGLGNLDFLCPNIDLQKEIIKYLDYCKDCLDNINYPENDNFELDSEILSFSYRAFKAYYTQKELLSEYKNQLTQIQNLNQAILQEAVQGKLVPQDPTDEPASKLLERIKAEKAKLGKKEKPLPPIKPEEIPFEIPKSWAWCRLGEICEVIGGFAFDSSRYSNIETNNQVIRLGNVKPNQLVLETSPVYINDEYSIEADKSLLKEGDILITMTGTKAKRDYLFSLCLKSKNFTSKNIFLNQRVGCFRFNDLIYSDFINFTLKDLSLLSPVFDSSTGAANQANIGMAALKEILIPLPTLSEQKRIVSEIEIQLEKTKQLKVHILANQQATEQLLKALLHQAFEVEENEVKV
ncbi:MAG: hypothetical protein RL308_1560 [Bacteroidota bacterium]|jgi:type I restriction enzyme S subunit